MKYTNDVCPHCEKEGTKHGVYLCESYGDYQSDKCKIICLTKENEQLKKKIEELEKFALSIVQECIAQIKKDENGVAYEAVARISEHFGVE